jgi:hypothetical protein
LLVPTVIRVAKPTSKAVPRGSKWTVYAVLTRMCVEMVLEVVNMDCYTSLNQTGKGFGALKAVEVYY